METAVEEKPNSEVVYRIQSVCECQGLLEADLDAQRNVVVGWAIHGGEREVAPANAVASDRDRFDVVWQCPLCGRNTFRSFYAGALSRVAPPPAGEAA
jgi:hypothetical protein